MTSQNTTIYTPFADGRPVRDIVEHTPALVNETWCRNLLRHTLDSLERQYASGAPHRAITPDTLVMLANGEALLLPAAEDAAPSSDLPADLHALALVAHYAITAELPPEGPLGPRLYDNYSEQLTKGLDSCLGPNRRLRPATVDAMRTLLGLEASAGVLAPAAPQGDDEQFVEPVGQTENSAPVEIVAPPPAVDAPETVSPPNEDAHGGDFFAPAIAPAPAENPVPEPVAIAAPETAVPENLEPAPAEPLSLREKTEAGMLRKPASQSAGEPPPRATEHVAPPQPPQASAEAPRAAPRKPSAGIPPGAQPAGAAQARPATGRSSRAQRWGMIAGAAIVALAAGGALVSYFQQNDARAVMPLSLPPAERAPGLDAGETVVAPPAEAVATDQPAGAQPADSPLDATTGAAPESDPGLPVTAAPGMSAAAGAGTAGAAGAVVNGTTYKLLIKPWGTVYVDGVDRGVSPPIKRLTLAPGPHTIRIANPNFPEHTMTVDAGARESGVIEHDFTAQAQ